VVLLARDLTIIVSQALEIIGRLESGESRSVVTASWNVRLSSVYDMKK
jgi:hypothetical protein